MAYVFPTRLFNPPSITPRIIGAAQSGGRSLSGIPQFADLSGGGYWVVDFPNVPLNTRPKLMAWRALAAAASTGVTSVIVPLADRRHQPLAVPHYTGADTFGLSIWDANAYWAAAIDEIDATLVYPYGLAGETVIGFAYASMPLIGGEHFSLQSVATGVHRLHRITRVISDNGTNVVAEIRPPLRETYSVGAAMNFNTPRCHMRLDGDMEATLELLKFGKGSARFVENFPPLPSGNSPGDSPA